MTDPDGHCWAWLQAICNLGQRIDNAYHGFGWHTNAQVDDILEADNKTLRERGISPTQIEKLTDKQIYAIGKAISEGKSSVIVDTVKITLAMLGANGTQMTSKTLWEDGKEHIDVENPNPGQRPGQIHYQDGVNKYIYDVESGEFEGLSQTQSKQLLSKPGVKDAIEKGLRFLGESK